MYTGQGSMYKSNVEYMCQWSFICISDSVFGSCGVCRSVIVYMGQRLCIWVNGGLYTSKVVVHMT